LVSQQVGEVRMLKQFWNDESGATAIEYGLAAALITVAIIVGARSLGIKTGGSLTKVGGSIK
jgi:pilus assembly protein Flp/PilA